MLTRVCEQQDELAAEAGSSLVADPFLFSLALDGSQPMPPDHLTKRVAILKEHLGIAQKSAETIARETKRSGCSASRRRPAQRGAAVPSRSGA